MPLPITVVAIDTTPDSVPLTRFAVEQTLRGIDVQEVLFFGGEPLGLGERFVHIQHFGSLDKYSEFVLKCLWPFIATEFILIVQWDGFVANPALWSDEFLAYDYIGAPWVWATDHHRVGNGGFCLRSKRLLEACRDGKVRRHPEIPFGGIEDIVICRLYRDYLEQQGIRFAPVDVAERFSYETGVPRCPPFGFHSPANLPLFVSEQNLLALSPYLQKKLQSGPSRDAFKHHCSLRGYAELLSLLA